MLTITVTRNKGWFGRFRTAQIMADDVEIGRVKSGKTVEIQVPEDATNLYAKMDWVKSPPYPVSRLQVGQSIYMNSHFTTSLLRALGITSPPLALEDQPR